MVISLSLAHFRNHESRDHHKYTFRELDNKDAIHWTKIFGLRLEHFLVSNGSRQVSFHSTHKTSFGLTVARIKARWRFRRWYQWYCVCCFIHSNLTSITGYFEQTIPDIYHLTSNTTFESKDEKNIPNSLGK